MPVAFKGLTAMACQNDPHRQFTCALFLAKQGQPSSGDKLYCARKWMDLQPHCQTSAAFIACSRCILCCKWRILRKRLWTDEYANLCCRMLCKSGLLQLCTYRPTHIIHRHTGLATKMSLLSSFGHRKWIFCFWSVWGQDCWLLGRAWASPYLVMSTWTLSVCHGPADRRTGVRHSNGACVSFFGTGQRTAWQRCMRLIFSHVAVYVTVVTLFRQSTHNTVLILV